MVDKVEAEIKPVPAEYKSVVRDIKLSGIVSKFEGKLMIDFNPCSNPNTDSNPKENGTRILPCCRL